MKTCLALAAFCLLFIFAAAAAPAPPSERQKELLDQILRTLPKSEPWEQWLKQTGAMPPDFDKLPSVPFLPDPLTFANGRKVAWSDWPKRREELLALFQHYVTGAWPVLYGKSGLAWGRGVLGAGEPGPTKRSSGTALASLQRERTRSDSALVRR